MVDKVVKPWDVYRAHVEQILILILAKLQQLDSKVSKAVRWVLQARLDAMHCRHALAQHAPVLLSLAHRVGSATQEFEPWVKWVIMDALLAMAVGLLTTRVPSLQSAFRAIGWL